VVLALAALTAGCSSSAKHDDLPATTTTTVAGVPTGATAVGNGAVPASPVQAVMADTYRTKGKPFSDHEFGFAPGNKITAAWYRMDDVWAVYFKGLTLATGAGKCAIAALETRSGRKYATETPYGRGTCTQFPDKVLPPGSLLLCADKAVIYKTQIPLTAKGMLTATLGRGYIPDGSVEGIRSRVAADAARAPLIAGSTGCYVQF
jgi:hypothetical protein